MNLTLAVDDKIVERARMTAAASGKSLNQVVREFLEQLAGVPALDSEVAELRQLAMKGRGSEPGWRFERDEIYAERLERRRGA